MKHNNTEGKHVNGNWFHRHLNFYEIIIQANIQKEAENISLAAFEFWIDKHAKNLLEEEINKFLCYG